MMQSLVIRAAFAMAVIGIMVAGTFVPPLRDARLPTGVVANLPAILYALWAVSLCVALPVTLRNARASARTVLKMAFFETGAIYGLVATLLGAPIIHLYIFGGVALFLIVSSFFFSMGE